MSVERILALGDDQLAARFQLVFPTGIPGGGDSDSIALRMDQPFDPTTITVGEYEIAYKGTKLKKTSMTDGTDKTFTIQVRIDQKWKVFDSLYALSKMTYDPNTGTAYPDAVTRFPIAIQYVDGQNLVVKTWTYNYCKLKEFAVQSNDQGSDDPLRISLTFIWGSFTVS